MSRMCLIDQVQMVWGGANEDALARGGAAFGRRKPARFVIFVDPVVKPQDDGECLNDGGGLQGLLLSSTTKKRQACAGSGVSYCENVKASDIRLLRSDP